ncbi:cytochrome P450 81C13-like [Impatiens glandulifera]|uniref:cytochrome P450 81C13-like n=1 Tax=Impatiens glandulifera TaxID=253017 RepID=UPI001FB0BA5F|nr:cytochrome P450 81C13-like [Impatiens glandulifera]
MEDLYYFFFFLTLTLIIIIKFILRHRRRRNLPPSPPSLPIIGHIHLINKTPQHKSLSTLSSKYGPILFLKFGSRPILLISSPSAAEECFTKNDIIFANRPQTMAGDHLTYNYTTFVFAPYGDLWRCLRRVSVIELFSSRSLQKYSFIRDEESNMLVHHLIKRFSNGENKIRLNYWLPVLTFNMMMRLVCGERCVEYEMAELEVGKRIVDDIMDRFAPGTPLSVCDYFPILKWIGYKGMKKKVMIHHKKRDEFLIGMLDKFRKQGKLNSISFIQSLINLQQSDPHFYSEDVIKSLISIMFIAGTGTSMITMESVMSLLLTHPNTLHKLRCEIDDKIGHKNLIIESDIVKLPYLRCIINETLRLRPTTPLLLPHYSSEDCVVGGYDIPKGTTLIVNAWAIQRDPMFWDDPEEFKPERFESVMAGGHDSFKFIPFGMGRRECPGNNMGLRMVSLAIATLVQCFEWEVVGEVVDLQDVLYSPRKFLTDDLF